MNACVRISATSPELVVRCAVTPFDRFPVEIGEVVGRAFEACDSGMGVGSVLRLVDVGRSNRGRCLGGPGHGGAIASGHMGGAM